MRCNRFIPFLFAMSAALSAQVSAVDVGAGSIAIQDYYSGSPGKELVSPFAKRIDKDFDGFAETERLQFDVYPYAGGRKLYSSKPRDFTTPVAPWISSCLLADINAWQPDGRVLLADSTWIISAGGITYRCLVSGAVKSAGKVQIYGARVDAPSGASWKYESVGYFLAAALEDTNGDEQYEHLIVRFAVYNGDEPPRDIKLIVLEVATGNVVRQRTYPAIR